MEKRPGLEPRRVVAGIYLALSAASYVVSNMLARSEPVTSLDKSFSDVTKVIAIGSLLRAAHHIAKKWKRG